MSTLREHERIAELESENELLARLCRLSDKRGATAVAAMRRSWSWRLTLPVRRAFDLLAAMRRRLVPAPLRPLPPRPVANLFAAPEELERQRESAPRGGLQVCVVAAVSGADGANGAAAAALRESLDAQTFPAREVVFADVSGAGGVDPAAALAAAVARTTAPLIAFAGPGDIFAPDALFRFAEALAAADAPAFVYASGLEVREGFRFCPSSAEAIVSTLPRPAFSLDSFRSRDFIGGCFACRRDRFEAAGGFREGAGSAATTDLLFRLCETDGALPAHIAAPLVARAIPEADADDASAENAETVPETVVADARRAVEMHLERVGSMASVETPDRARAVFRIREPRPDPAPLVSILIPNRENPEVLRVCVESILRVTAYPNYEVVIVESGSSKPETFALYDRLSEDTRVRVVRFPKKPDEPFNYSRKCNFGATLCHGEFLLMLNSDTEAVLSDWIDEMLGFAARPGVGVVGSMLLFGNGTVQHAGIQHRPGGLPDHVERCTPALSPGLAGRLLHVRRCQAVTFACAMIPMSVWKDLGGLDETFAVAFNDVDFCYRAHERGLAVLWTPFARLFHHESLVRGSDLSGANIRRFLGEIAHLRERWGDMLSRPDPYFDDIAFTALPSRR